MRLTSRNVVPLFLAVVFIIAIAKHVVGEFLSSVKGGAGLISEWPAWLPQEWVLLQIIVIGTILLFGLWDTLKSKSRFPQWLTKAVISIIVVIGVAQFLFGSRLVDDPLMQKAHNIRTGEPEYMVYQDSAGRWKRGFEKGELLRPSDCRPDEYEHWADDGDTFPYHTHGTCLSPTDGVTRMIPVSEDKVPMLPNLMPFKTPAEVAVEEEEKMKAEEAARMAELERVRHQAALQRAVNPPVEIPEYAEGRTCDDHRYKKMPDCKKVIFKAGQKFIVSGRSGHCPVESSGKIVKRVDLSDAQFEYTATRSGIAHFYNQQSGTTVFGFRCG